jgi:hypothetical protein
MVLICELVQRRLGSLLARSRWHLFLCGRIYSLLADPPADMESMLRYDLPYALIVLACLISASFRMPPVSCGHSACGCSIGQCRWVVQAGYVWNFRGAIGLLTNGNKSCDYRCRAGRFGWVLLSKEAVDVSLEIDLPRRRFHSNLQGFHFGGYRFFSKSKAVEDLWTEIRRMTCSVTALIVHLLRRKVLFLSAEADRSTVQARHLQIDARYFWLKARFSGGKPRNFESG